MLAKLKSWLFFCAGQGFRKGLLAGMLLPVGTVIFSIAYSISQGSIPIDLGRLVFESLTVAVHLLLFTVSLGALLGLIMAVAMGIILVFALGLAPQTGFTRSIFTARICFCLHGSTVCCGCNKYHSGHILRWSARLCQSDLGTSGIACLLYDIHEQGFR